MCCNLVLHDIDRINLLLIYLLIHSIKMRGSIYITLAIVSMSNFSCMDNNRDTKDTSVPEPPKKGTYGYDASFLRKHNKTVIELKSADGKSRVLLSADYQGRVMTSTAAGDSGTSYGWINYDLISSKERKKQFNPVGGEERFWLGPEGGQFSLYFKNNDSFRINSWQVPSVIDTEAYDVSNSSPTQAVFSKKATLENYSGTRFDIDIERRIRLLTRQDLQAGFNLAIPDSGSFVAYESNNIIKNAGADDWKKETGLLSIWLLGMFTPSAETIAIIPFIAHPNARTYITTDYFGEIPEDRLTIQDNVVFFRCDGKFRSKLGISPIIAKPVAGSYDFTRNILTLILFNVDRNGPYVNSKWEIQQFPYKGDAVNSYNDGPLPDGSQLGFFYELESSSWALQLNKNDSAAYKQVTCHFQGSLQEMNKIARQVLGVDLTKIPVK